MSNNSHLETPDFPLQSSGDVNGPAHRQAHEIGCGAVVIRTTQDGGRTVCLKLTRIGKEYLHHYVLALDPRPQGPLALTYVDPEEQLFDCFATLEIDFGQSADVAAEPGHAIESKDGFFIKVLDVPKSQKMYGFIDPATGEMRARQERSLKNVHPDWSARAKMKDEVIDLAHLLERFAADL